MNDQITEGVLTYSKLLRKYRPHKDRLVNDSIDIKLLDSAFIGAFSMANFLQSQGKDDEAVRAIATLVELAYVMGHRRAERARKMPKFVVKE